MTIQGPRLVPKSFAFAGPRPTVTSPACTSRADQSFIRVKPAISGRSAASTPITAAISSSKSSIVVVAGRLSASPGPRIAAGLEK